MAEILLKSKAKVEEKASGLDKLAEKSSRAKLKKGVVFECPALNLLTGKFLYKYDPKARKKLEGYIARYAIKATLKVDDSPIKRVEVCMLDLIRKHELCRFVLPMVMWEVFLNNFPEYLMELQRELERQGVPRLSYKLKKVRHNG